MKTTATRILFRIGLIALLLMSVFTGTASAIQTNVYYVDINNVGNDVPPYTSWGTAATNIQDAIDVADAAYVEDEVIGLVRVAAGHYLLTETLTITNNPVILLNDAGRDDTLIDGQGTIQTMYIDADAVIDGFTVTNGYRSGTLNGGNIQLMRGTVRNCRITGGWVSGFGGGISLQGASARLEHSLITGNRGGQGGGIMLTSGIISDCIITNNISEAYFQRGGGIRMSGGTVERSLIAYNRGGEGAGIKLYNGTVRNSLILNNRADISPFRGGGVDMENGLLQNSTIAGNSANLTGGGVYLNGANARVRNSIVYFNSATTSGNLHRLNGWFEFSCTFPAVPDDDKASNNTALDPQFVDRKTGDYRLLPGSPAIDSGSATGAPADDYDGDPRPLDGNGDGTAAYDMGALEAPAFTDAPLRCNLIGTPVTGFAPLSVDFQAYVAGPDTNGMQYAWDFGDGQTLDFSPQADVSHVYDFGVYDVMLTVSNAAGQVTNIVKTAYIEVTSDTVYVSPSGDHEAPFGSWATAATNLQDAVNAALDTPELKSSVLVGDGHYLLYETLIIEKNITVESLNGPDVTILDGGGAANVNRAVFIGAAGAVFRGFTVSNAVTTDPGAGIYLQGGAVHDCIVAYNETTGHGGGIFMASGTTVSNCLVFRNLIASGSNGGGVYVSNAGLLQDSEIRANRISGNGHGGGVALVGGAARVENCWIHNNTNHYRGGGVSMNQGTLADNIIEHNRASQGGGVFSDRGVIERNAFAFNFGNAGAAYLRTDSLFRNNLVIGNHSTSVGGGIRLQHGSGQVLENNTVVGNYATTYGGGIYQETGAITNTIIWGNHAGTAYSDFGGTAIEIGYSCAPELTADPLTGNINSDPLFIRNGKGYGLDHVPGKYRLNYVNSPARDAGINRPWMFEEGATDLEGFARILGGASGTVDMGAYETQKPPGTLIMIR